MRERDTAFQERLFEKYPKIFQDRTKSMQETCMCWGISTGPGWEQLIDRLCSTLQWNTDNNFYPQVIFDQVKEKFGELTIYYHIEEVERPAYRGPLSDKFKWMHIGEIEGKISFVRQMSWTICEDCGTNQNVKATEGWISHLCEPCATKLGKTFRK